MGRFVIPADSTGPAPGTSHDALMDIDGAVTPVAGMPAVSAAAA